ncbi:CLUMA_CG014220, isoform A [Clunio marinus]|uniref:CLUMA_CG014220, isoform A n=1 Tax=Clunio marinus TaxID=568069 RepID=A0A1J1IN49_9DIPT|nr:CLUMA_CG014220, isoform A [Clunio marinus]
MSQTEMDSRHPKWLNIFFFEKVIKHYCKDEEAKVMEFVIRSGSKPGESFASDLLRASINYLTVSGTKSISVIVKMMPSKEEGDIDGKRLFMNEMKMYGDTLIDINRVLVEANADVKLFPTLIYQSTEPAVIVLEDLSVSGFTTLQVPEDYETSKLIFTRLAAFHAATFVLLENKNDFSNYNFSVYHMPDSIQESFFRHNLDILKTLILENAWPELNKPEYVDRIDEVIEKCSIRGKRAFTPTAGGFNVLNHGDFVLRNMLFQKIDGEIRDVQFLDFQLSVYASPAVDIFYALYGSMTLKNRKKYRKEIILLYYETFKESLKTYGYDKEPPTLLDLNVELTRNGSLAAHLCLCYLPYLLAEWSAIDSNVMYNINEDSVLSKRQLYLSEKFSEVIKEEFLDFFYSGFI